MFPTTCATTASLSDPAMVDDRYTMPARSPSVDILSRVIGLPGQSLPLRELALQAVWA